MVNYSTEDRRRVDWVFGIGYGDDTEKAEAVIRRLADADSRILKDPAVFVAVSELAESSVNLVVRAWVEKADYWGVHFDMNKNVYKVFDEEGLNIPFPQMDIYLNEADAN
jgi:small conductance mechanosensitive channel